MKTAVVVQARMTSKRLPGKVMMPLDGKPVIRHVLERAKQIKGVDVVVCAVPDDAASVPVETEAWHAGARTARGPEADVLGRYMIAAALVEADIIIRITADCPLIDPMVCAAVLAPARAGSADYVSNVMPRTWPVGLDCEAFTIGALTRTHAEASTSYDREHVTSYMQRAAWVRRVNIRSTDLRWTLDTAEDYERLCALYE